MGLRNWIRSWLAEPAAPAMDAAPPTRTAPTGVSTQAMLAGAIADALAKARKADPLMERTPGQVFTPYAFDAAIGGGLAMDSVEGQAVTTMMTWAQNQALAEGQGFFGYPALAQLQQRAEYRHACEIWAEHAVRKWIKLTGGTPDLLKAIEERMKDLRVRDVVQEWCYQDQAYGRAQIFLDFGDADNPQELETPLLVATKVDKRRPLVALNIVEPMWSAPGTYATTNPLRGDFYDPRVWNVYGKQVHHSRMLTMVSRPVADMLKPAYAFGGLSLTQMMYPYVINWLNSRQAAADMLNSYSVMNLATDMSSIMYEGAGDCSPFYNRLDMFVANRDNRSLMVTNKDTEELKNVAVPLSGVPDLQSQAHEQLAAVARIPLSIYLQVTPTGLNASSDGETRNFYADVHAYQEKNIRPALGVIIDAVQMSLNGTINETVQFEFIQLWEMSDKDKADIRKSDAEADVSYVAAGVVSPEEVRERLSNDETSMYAGVDLTDPPPELPTDGGEGEAPAMDGWNERDHPRDADGKFAGEGALSENRRFDPGELNIPGRLKNLDRDDTLAELEGRQDSVTPSAAGIMNVLPDGRMLFLRRSADARDYPGHWCFPGGLIEDGENPQEAAKREMMEETGVHSPHDMGAPIDARDGFLTFRHERKRPFAPAYLGAGDEHDDHYWVHPAAAPEPLHPGVRATLEKLGAL